MLVLGIDPGTATTGYGLIREEERGPVLVAYGTILTRAGTPMPQRLVQLYEEMTKLIALHRPETG